MGPRPAVGGACGASSVSVRMSGGVSSSLPAASPFGDPGGTPRPRSV